MATTMIEKPLNQGQVAELFGVTPKTLIKWVRDGSFPQPFRPGPRRLYWHPDVIERELRGRAARHRRG